MKIVKYMKIITTFYIRLHVLPYFHYSLNEPAGYSMHLHLIVMCARCARCVRCRGALVALGLGASVFCGFWIERICVLCASRVCVWLHSAV